MAGTCRNSRSGLLYAVKSAKKLQISAERHLNLTGSFIIKLKILKKVYRNIILLAVNKVK